MNWMCTLLLTLLVLGTSHALGLLEQDGEESIKEQLDVARQFCMLQKETDYCDGFLCRQLFDLPPTFPRGGMVGSKRSNSQAIPPPSYGGITHLRFGRKRRSTNTYRASEDLGGL